VMPVLQLAGVSLRVWLLWVLGVGGGLLLVLLGICRQHLLTGRDRAEENEFEDCLCADVESLRGRRIGLIKQRRRRGSGLLARGLLMFLVALGTWSGAAAAARMGTRETVGTVPASVRALVVRLGAPVEGRATPTNAIQAENARPGSRSWEYPPADGRAIEGYLSQVSAAPGETVQFHVSTTPPARYRIELYRFGWYAGDLTP
jgi:hypothetical protein